MTRHLKRAEAQIINNKSIELVKNSLALHYKETTGWKNAENEVSEVQFESIGEALHKSMLEVGSIIGVEGE